MIAKPWQVLIEYSKELGFLTLRVRQHTHGSIAFSHDATVYCGGPAEEDADGYTIRCRDEPSIVQAAREIALMSEMEES